MAGRGFLDTSITSDAAFRRTPPLGEVDRWCTRRVPPRPLPISLPARDKMDGPVASFPIYRRACARRSRPTKAASAFADRSPHAPTDRNALRVPLGFQTQNVTDRLMTCVRAIPRRADYVPFPDFAQFRSVRRQQRVLEILPASAQVPAEGDHPASAQVPAEGDHPASAGRAAATAQGWESMLGRSQYPHGFLGSSIFIVQDSQR